MSFHEVNKTDLGELLALSEQLNILQQKENESKVELYTSLIKSLAIQVGNAIAKVFGAR